MKKMKKIKIEYCILIKQMEADAARFFNIIWFLFVCLFFDFNFVLFSTNTFVLILLLFLPRNFHILYFMIF